MRGRECGRSLVGRAVINNENLFRSRARGRKHRLNGFARLLAGIACQENNGNVQTVRSTENEKSPGMPGRRNATPKVYQARSRAGQWSGKRTAWSKAELWSGTRAGKPGTGRPAPDVE